MATSKQFIDLMYEGLNQAHSLINEKLLSLYNKTLNDVLNSNIAMTDLINRREEIIKESDALRNKIKELSKELDVVNDSINNLDSKVDDDISKDIKDIFSKTNLVSMYSRLNKSEFEALNLIKDSIELNNVLGLEKIRDHFRQMMSLAVGLKEQREVLAKFYSFNWNELGINLPINRNIGDIKMKDGVITIGNKLLN